MSEVCVPTPPFNLLTLRHYDGCPLLAIVTDATGSGLMAYAVAERSDMSWPLLMVPLNPADRLNLRFAAEDDITTVMLGILLRTDCGYYLIDFHNQSGDMGLKFVNEGIHITDLPKV